MTGHDRRRLIPTGIMLTFVATLAGAGAAAAQQNPSKNPPTQTSTSQMASPKTSESETFVRNTAQGTMAEVALGQLAQSKAESPAVKQFAQRMVDDHSKNEEPLRNLAKSVNVTWPSEVSAKHQELQRKLSGLQGAAFDRAYMSAMVDDHKHEVGEFQKATKSADPNVQAYASQTLPVLQEHLTLAQNVQKELSTKAPSGR